MTQVGRRKSGFTLIEIIVASALFVGVGLVIAGLFEWAFEAQQMGQLQITAQADARNAITKMHDEMGQSAAPNITLGSFPVPSSIFLPNGYSGNASGGTFGAHALDNFTNVGTDPNNPELFSTNVLVFTSPNQSVNNFVPTDLTQYNVVMYYVSDTQGATIQQNGNVVWRKVFPLLTAGAVTGVTNDGTHWLADANNLVKIDTVDNSTLISKDAIIQEGTGETVTFNVHHFAANKLDTSFVDPQFNTIMDRHTFQLDITVTKIFTGHLGQVRNKTASLTDSVTIRSFN